MPTNSSEIQFKILILELERKLKVSEELRDLWKQEALCYRELVTCVLDGDISEVGARRLLATTEPSKIAELSCGERVNGEE